MNNDDVERFLQQVTPRGAPADLRERARRAVAASISETPPARRRPIGLATAAALLFSIGLNHHANRTSDVRVERAFGIRPVSPKVLALAQDVAEAAGPETGRWILDRFSNLPPITRPDLARHAAELQRLVRELALEPREKAHETPNPQVPQVDRDRSRSLPGRVLLVERLVHERHRPTA